ncbi:hypothetical protein M758_9G028400 [Ceratodon purpureus]|nr:hypothetical protein M758_9G028400 [Ceratodon purpureus]
MLAYDMLMVCLLRLHLLCRSKLSLHSLLCLRITFHLSSDNVHQIGSLDLGVENCWENWHSIL